MTFQIIARNFLVAVALLLGCSIGAEAQSPLGKPVPIVIGSSMTLRSTILAEERTIMVRLPDGYEASARRYPVLYVLDGETHFIHVSGIVDFLTETRRIPAMIVVGVSNTNRNRDFTPAANNKRGMFELPALDVTLDAEIADAGGADKFLAFLKKELQPALAARYRTVPFSVLAGHSLGGLFTVHAAISDPSAFNAYIAISPSLWWDDEALLRRAKAALPDYGANARWLYAVTGEEGGKMLGSLGDVKSLLEVARPKGLNWYASIMPGESHNTTPHRVIFDGLQWLFRDYPISQEMELGGDIGRIEQHYAEASRLYGFDLSLDEAGVNRLGYLQLDPLKRPARAVAIFRRNVALHPSSPNAYDSLADALEADGRDDEALINRRTAVGLADRQRDPLLPILRKSLTRLQTKLANPGK